MPEHEGKRVLIVDDERLIADTLGTIFLLAGHTARAAYSAEEALEVAAEWPPEFAIIDVCLPEMNGVRLAIRLKAEYPECRLTLISGYGSAGGLLSEALASGYTFELLAKPMHPTELLGLVH